MYDNQSVIMGLGSFEYLCVNDVLVSSNAERTMATELNILCIEIATGSLDLVSVKFMLTRIIESSLSLT